MISAKKTTTVINIDHARTADSMDVVRIGGLDENRMNHEMFMEQQMEIGDHVAGCKTV